MLRITKGELFPDPKHAAIIAIKEADQSLFKNKTNQEWVFLRVLSKVSHRFLVVRT
jgi:hypothetical protein